MKLQPNKWYKSQLCRTSSEVGNIVTTQDHAHIMTTPQVTSTYLTSTVLDFMTEVLYPARIELVYRWCRRLRP